MEKHLNEFVVGQKGIVKKIEAEGKIKRRLFDMGVTPNTEIYLSSDVCSSDLLVIQLR